MDGLEDRWNEALCQFFYNREFAGRPAYLSVDEDILVDVARMAGMPNPEFALASLRGAIRPYVHSEKPLTRWVSRMLTWKREAYPGPPPFLTVLAVTVLAAVGGEELRAQRAYYKPLRELLGLPLVPPSMPQDFDSDVQSLWLNLNLWLEKQDGRVGLPTATSQVGGLSNVGWALSQAVMRGGDREKLPRFFMDLGLEPEEEGDGVLLVEQLRRWVRRGHHVSKRLVTVLDNPNLEPLLARTLENELARWDGALRDEAGRPVLPLLLTWDEVSREFGTAIQVPTWLAERTLKLEAGEVRLGAAGGLVDVFALQDDQLLQETVLSGTVAGDEEVKLQLKMAAAECRALAANYELGRHVAVSSARVGCIHTVLVAAGQVPEATIVMNRLGSRPAERTLSRRGQGHWVAFRYEPWLSEELSGPLAALAPRGSGLATLDGGLLLDGRRHWYLHSGPPDVLVEESEHNTHVVLDNYREVEVTQGRARLGGLQLSPGKHEIRVGRRRLTFRLVEGERRRFEEPTLATAFDYDDYYATRLHVRPIADGHAAAHQGEHAVMLNGANLSGSATSALLDFVHANGSSGANFEDLPDAPPYTYTSLSAPHDQLLTWMSERGTGDNTLFRNTHTWLGLDGKWSITMQSLAALGHVEVDWQHRRWEVTPPTAVTIPGTDRRAVLCGARPRSLLRQLDLLGKEQALADLGGKVVLLFATEQKKGPSRLQLACDSVEHLQKLCVLLGLRHVPQAADRLLQVLPTLGRLMAGNAREDIPGGAQVKKLGDDIDRADPFVSNNVDPQLPNAYRFDLYDGPRFFFRHRSGRLFEGGRGEVIYLELRQRGCDVLRWDEAAGELLVPIGLRLPNLYDRAVVLRSGLLPTFDNKRLAWRYRNIDADVAYTLGRRLYQEVRHIPLAPFPVRHPLNEAPVVDSKASTN